MTKPMLLVIVGFVLTPSVVMADCYVSWNCGGSAQCKELYGSVSGSNGPFPSCSSFKQVDAVSSCSCSGGSSSSPIPAVSSSLQQMQMDVARQVGSSLGKALVDALMGNPQQDAERQAEAVRAQQEAEQQRQIEEVARQEALRRQQEQERRAEATKQELLHSLKGVSASTDLGLKDTASGSGPQLTLKDTGAGGGLQLKTGESTPPPKTLIHDGFNLPAIDPSRE